MNIHAYNSVEHFWTSDRVVELKRLFESGLSNQQIAVEMHVKSRNAIIGKLHRMGLRRETVERCAQSRGAGAIIARVKAAPRPHRAMAAIVRTKPVVVEKPAIECDGSTDPAVDISASRVTLLSARATQCRWPAADDGSATMVCGAPTRAGSYCSRHFRISVQQRPVASQSRAVG